MTEALEAAAAERPFVLVLEDLHWSDSATLDLVALLARRRGTARPKLKRCEGEVPAGAQATRATSISSGRGGRPCSKGRPLRAWNSPRPPSPSSPAAAEASCETLARRELVFHFMRQASGMADHAHRALRIRRMYRDADPLAHSRCAATTQLRIGERAGWLWHARSEICFELALHFERGGISRAARYLEQAAVPRSAGQSARAGRAGSQVSGRFGQALAIIDRTNELVGSGSVSAAR
jgi:hypothetical protein